MNAMFAPTPHLLDFEECPEALDNNGRAGWAQIIALQAHVTLAQLRAEITKLRAAAAPCATCGGLPCANPSFCAICREADARHQQARPSRLPENWHEMSLESLWHHLNSNRPTPQVVIEAIWYAIQERGLAVLKEPATVERLSRCDEAALAEIDRRISQLKEDAGQ